MSVIYAVVGVLVLRWFVLDYLANRRAGTIRPNALPGATPAAVWLIAVGIGGSLLILGVEIAGEYALGVVDQQQTLAYAMILPVLFAPVIEEVIFRGYLVIDKRGRAALIAGVLGFSLVFALIHGHLIGLGEEDEPWLVWKGGAKGWFTTAILFSQSLWWYFLRLGPWNPTRSLIPCMAAHFAVNLGVIITKAAQGYLG